MAGKPLRHFLQHLVVGTLAALVFGALVLWFDLAGLATLIAESSEPGLALVLLFVGLISTFAPLALLFAFLQGAGNGEDRG